MMGLGSADVERMSLWEYESRLYHWNEAHGGDDKAPDPVETQKVLDLINMDPRLTN
jgi:hypothetical protein